MSGSTMLGEWLSDGTITLLKTSTNTLKLLNPNADALMLGDATHEGGDIKVYRDSSGNLALSFDADAASNATGLNLYAGLVCQNKLAVGRTTLHATYTAYIMGFFKATSGIATDGWFETVNGAGLRAETDSTRLNNNIIVSSANVGHHSIALQIDTSDILVVQATGNGAGGITNPAIGLYGTTPTTQATHIADPAESTAGNNAAIDAILVALENIGILASS